MESKIRVTMETIMAVKYGGEVIQVLPITTGYVNIANGTMIPLEAWSKFEWIIHQGEVCDMSQDGSIYKAKIYTGFGYAPSRPFMDIHKVPHACIKPMSVQKRSLISQIRSLSNTMERKEAKLEKLELQYDKLVIELLEHNNGQGTTWK